MTMFDRDSVQSRGPMTNRKYVLGPGSDLQISPYTIKIVEKQMRGENRTRAREAEMDDEEDSDEEARFFL